MKNIKLNTAVYIYIITLALSMLVRDNTIQNIILIGSLFLLNYIIIMKCKIENKPLITISILIIIINIAIIIISYIQILKLGFNDGLAKDYVFNINYWDHYNYYYESEILKDYWVNGNLVEWLHGIAPAKMFYGYYNIFVIFNAILKILIGNNLISLIFFKLQFTVGSIYLVYLIAIKYINYKFAIIPVILMNLFPAYIQSNISLVRDNLILFFSLLVFYEIIYQKENLFRLSTYVIILICIRSYVALPIVLIAITYKNIILRKLKIKSIILYFLVTLILISSIGMFLQIQGYGFFGLELLKRMKDFGDIGQWNEQISISPKELILYNLKFLVLGDKVSKAQYFSPFIYDWLIGLSYLFIPMFCLPTLLVFISSNKSVRQFNVIIFVIAFVINGLILYVYGGNVPRLYFPWIWGQFILFSYLIQRIYERFDKKIITSIIFFYCFFIIAILKIYIVK